MASWQGLDEDVAYLAAYAQQEGLPSRSAALHRGVRLLRSATLSGEYAAAWKECEDSGDAGAWDATTADGLITPAA